MKIQSTKLAKIDKVIQAPEIKKGLDLLPEGINKKLFIMTFYNAVIRNPKLMQCTKESLINAFLQCCEWKLEPSLGMVYLVPYRNNKKPGNPFECQAQIGYKGLIELANRIENVQVSAHIIYENDEYDIQYAPEEKIFHKPKLKGDRGDMIGAYCIWKKKDSVSFHFMTIDEIYKIREKSISYRTAEMTGAKDSIWHEWPEAMIKKTVIRQRAKYERLHSTFAEILEKEEAFEFGDASIALDEEPKPIETTEAKATEPTEEVSLEDKLNEICITYDLDAQLVNAYLDECVEMFEMSKEAVLKRAINNPDKFKEQFNRWIKINEAMQKDAGGGSFLEKLKEAQSEPKESTESIFDVKGKLEMWQKQFINELKNAVKQGLVTEEAIKAKMMEQGLKSLLDLPSLNDAVKFYMSCVPDKAK